MKYCTKCGNELVEGAGFCPKCGATTSENANQTTAQTINYNYNYNYNQNGTNVGLVTKRDIAVAIILSFVTCGIYLIYWYIVTTNDVNRVSNQNGPSGGTAFLYSLLTCGIYTYYWFYKMGKQLYEAGQRQGKDISDNSVLYLVLGLVGLGIVNYGLIQNDLNKFAA